MEKLYITHPLLNLKLNTMKKLFFVLLLGCIVVSSNAQTSKNFIDQPYIEVTGRAKLEIVPDEIFIGIVIKEDDSKGKLNLEDLERKMIKSLESIGINIKEDLKVLDYSSNFKDYWYKKSSIRNTKSYQLKVNSGKMVAKVFMAMEKNNISNITVESTDHSKIEEFRQDVKVKAMKAAKIKAVNLAKAIDQKAGKAIYIQERSYMPYRKELSNVAFMMESSPRQADDIPNLDFEKIVLEYEIFARFILE